MKLARTLDGPRWMLQCTQPGCHHRIISGPKEPHWKLTERALGHGWAVTAYTLCPLHNKGGKK